jgi:hypothetical protein
MVRHLADLWHLPGEQLAGLAGIAPSLGSLVEDATHAISDLVSALLDKFRCGMRPQCRHRQACNDDSITSRQKFDETRCWLNTTREAVS